MAQVRFDLATFKRNQPRHGRFDHRPEQKDRQKKAARQPSHAQWKRRVLAASSRVYGDDRVLQRLGVKA